MLTRDEVMVAVGSMTQPERRSQLRRPAQRIRDGVGMHATMDLGIGEEIRECRAVDVVWACNEYNRASERIAERV